VITFDHAVGCPKADMMNVIDFVTRNPWLLALIGIFVGPFINFYGRKFLPWVIGVLSGGIVALAVFIICGFLGLTTYFYYEDTADAGTDEGLYALIAVALSFFAGFGIGYIMKSKFLTLGFMVLGAIAGVFFGAILFTLALVHLSDEAWVLILSVVVMGLLGAVLALKLKDGVMIMVTSFIGAYMFVRGISIFLGGYPGEIEIITMIREGTYDFTISLICYLIGILVLFIWGICVQNRHKHDDDEHFKSS